MSLNTDTNRIYEIPHDTNSLPIEENTKIYEGALVGRTTDGYARPLQAGDNAVGFAKEHTDNSNGAKGDKNVDVKATGKISLFISGIALSDVGARVYATDDNTFTLTDTGNSYVGKLVRFERSDYGIVAFDFLTSEETAATQTTTTESQE